MDYFYSTSYGKLFLSTIEEFMETKEYQDLKGRVQLIITSPPFPLNKKKEYGNLQGNEFKEWLAGLSSQLCNLLTPDGSIVIEMGNGWEPKSPTFSTLPIESLLEFKNKGNLKLCQEFICYNPARLPSPAQWVTIERIRTIDSYTRLWWMSRSERPKADNRKVLRPYSERMKRLLKKQSYNSGKRPSNHKINETSFLKSNEGSIMPNVIQIEEIMGPGSARMPENIFSLSNTNSNTKFIKECKKNGYTPHPARMPMELVEFFVEFLTDEGDIVFDPFGGSNTTGFIAEKLKRKWYATEVFYEYAEQSKLRFEEVKKWE